MSELTPNQYLIIIAVLVFISIVMLFLLSRSKRDTQELQQDLNKTIGDYNQLAERFDALSAVKNQLEQQAERCIRDRAMTVNFLTMKMSKTTTNVYINNNKGRVNPVSYTHLSISANITPGRSLRSSKITSTPCACKVRYNSSAYS